VAKGRDLLAAQIRDEARWAGVPMVENPPLARALYRQVEVGQSIPFALYAAVAGILAWVYRREVEEKMRRRRPPEATGAGRQGDGADAPAPGTAVLPAFGDGAGNGSGAGPSAEEGR
jgi:flagellar biosynthesis protein FlhB